MSILNVNTLQPVGSGQTITVTAANITASSSALTVGSITNTSGSTVVAAGTTAAPSISPTGDSNTGIFFPAADTIAFAEGGVEAARFDSSGRFGLGTASPQNELHLNSSSSAVKMRISHSGNSSNGLIFGFATSNVDAVLSNTENGVLLFGTNNTERARITSTGNVQIANGNLVFSTAGTGIDFSATANSSGTMTSELLSDYEEGTWTPSQGAALTVNGTFSSEGNYTKIGRFVIAHGSVAGSTNISIAASNSIIAASLPFTAATSPTIAMYGSAGNSATTDGMVVQVGGTSIYATETMASTSRIYFTVTYTV